MNKCRYLVLLAACFALTACGGNNDPTLQKCSGPDECPGDLSCIMQEGLCKRPITKGGSCASSDAYCEDSECIDGICGGESGGGKEAVACSDSSPCRNGTQCISGICRQEAGANGKCSATVICSVGTCVQGKCQLTVGPGQACNNVNLCVDGYDCYNDICLKPVGPGGSCASSVTYCEDGSDCVEGLCPNSGSTSGTCEDKDGDGIADRFDRCDVDTDNDGIVNCMDLDSDGDGIPDSVERGKKACSTPLDSDGDGIYDFLSLDSDSNGIPDNIEGLDAEGNLIDTDNDTVPDSSSIDNDGDGLSDLVEITGMVNHNYSSYSKEAPRGADCNHDGKPDEIGTIDQPFDCDGDTVPDYLDADSDGDGVPDALESINDTNNDGYFDRYSQDSDGDGLSDAEESGCTAKWTCTEEGVKPMPSNNGMTCGEALPATFTLNLACVPEVVDGKVTFQTADIDGDGLVDGKEVICVNEDGTTTYSKFTADTDGDGFGDLAEYNAAFGSGMDPAQAICNPKLGVTQKDDCEDCTGIFDFYFELPYIATYSAEEENSAELLFVPSVSKLDVVFNLDTTNSMGEEVKNIKDKVNSTIIPGIRNRVSDSAFGVSHFDDFPTRSTPKSTYDYLPEYALSDNAYGHKNGPDTPFELLGQPEVDATKVTTNVNKLTLHNGADLPESGFESLWQIVKGDDKTEPQVAWHPYGGTAYSNYFSDSVIPRTTCPTGRWGGACFRDATLPVVIHITDTTSHDGNQCTEYTENSDFKLSSCTVTGKTKTYVQPYDPIYVENAHNSDDVYAAYNEKGARIISIFRGVSDAEKGKQLTQLIETSQATNAYVPVCAFKTDATTWTCGENKCCTTTDTKGNVTSVNPLKIDNHDMCVLSYGISSGDKLSDTLVSGVDALVKYATSNVAAVIRGDAIDGYEGLTTACFIKGVEALSDGYIAPPESPEKECNPVAEPAAFNGSSYPNGYKNFAIGTSSHDRVGAKLNFRVKAENNCVKPTINTQVFNAYIDIVDPTSGLVFGTREVSIVIPGEEAQQTVVY